MRALVFVPLLLTACPGEPASPTVTTLSDASTSTEPQVVEAGAGPVAESDAGPKLCGCALCEPIVGDDACSTAADCAPATQCHAKACVAKAKAEPKVSGMACTSDFQCAAIEANACLCVSGKCAIGPRAKTP